MKTSTVIKELLNEMELNTEKNKALRLSIITILNNLGAEKTKSEYLKGKAGRKSYFDIGKAKALREAGWSVAQMAEEMGYCEQTVRTQLKKAGIPLPSDEEVTND